MKKTSILKLEKHDEKQEMEFEFEFLKSLTIQERFKMFEERNLFLKSLLYKNDDRETTTITKRETPNASNKRDQGT